MPDVRKIKLITQEITRGTRLERIVTDKSTREIFAEIRSVTRAEYYQAGAQGMTVEGSALVWAFEYHGENILELAGIRYAVIRTYRDPASKKLEIYYGQEAGPGTPAGGSQNVT